MNQIRDEIYDVMEDKGFHSIEYTQKEALIFRQLCHLATEWGEAYWAYRRACSEFSDVPAAGRAGKAIEEVADIMIVAYDLAGIVGLDISDDPYPTGYTPQQIIPLMAAIAQTCDEYRKYGTLEGLKIVLSYAQETIAAWGDSPMEAVERKMEKNRLRPRLYGTKEAT